MIWQVEVFFDGECPLCRRELDLLRRLDRGRGRVRFTDIADPAFDAVALGRAHADLMDRIHGRLPDGAWVEGVEVFRRIYSALGLGLLVAPTRLPGVSHVLDAAYRLFARNRLRWTGRCDAKGCAAPARSPERARRAKRAAAAARSPKIPTKLYKTSTSG